MFNYKLVNPPLNCISFKAQLIKFMFDRRNRNNRKTGLEVEIVQKQDQRTGDLIIGFFKKILTKPAFHPHGIKVMLETGEVGRVKEITEKY